MNDKRDIYVSNMQDANMKELCRGVEASPENFGVMSEASTRYPDL